MLLQGRNVTRSIGTFRYSPKLNGSLNRRDGGSTKWWLVIDVDRDLGRYCREMYRMSRWSCDKLQRPVWEAHISVIRNEEPADEFKALWEKYNYRPVEFEYDMYNASGDDTYVWLPVVCERALDIREELGLPRQPYFSLHLTIGNRKEQS